MKKIFFSMLIVLLAAGPAFSGCPMCGPDGKKESVREKKVVEKAKKLSKKLDLSDEQAKRVEDLIFEKMEKKKAVHAEAQQKIEVIKADYRAKLKSILTPEQLERYNAWQQEQEDKDKKRSKKEGKD